MYYAIDKYVGAVLVLLCVACKGTDPRTVEAQNLYDSAVQAADAGQYNRGLSLLDSLDNNYVEQTDVLRQSMELRPRLILGQGRIDIDSIDAYMAKSKITVDSMMNLLTLVSLPSVDGFFVETKSYSPSFTNTTGISPRVTQSGEFYIVSSVNTSGNLHHSSLSLVSDGATVTTDTVPYDSALNYRINNSETVTFSANRCGEFGKFASDHRNAPATLIFNGENGRKKTVKLSASDVNGIALLYDFSTLVNTNRTLAIERERLTKKIELAQSKIAAKAE